MVIKKKVLGIVVHHETLNLMNFSHVQLHEVALRAFTDDLPIESLNIRGNLYRVLLKNPAHPETYCLYSAQNYQEAFYICQEMARVYGLGFLDKEGNPVDPDALVPALPQVRGGVSSETMEILPIQLSESKRKWMKVIAGFEFLLILVLIFWIASFIRPDWSIEALIENRGPAILVGGLVVSLLLMLVYSVPLIWLMQTLYRLYGKVVLYRTGDHIRYEVRIGPFSFDTTQFRLSDIVEVRIANENGDPFEAGSSFVLTVKMQQSQKILVQRIPMCLISPDDPEETLYRLKIFLSYGN